MAKEIFWKGRTEEETKNLDMKEFQELVSSRQRRSLKRGFTEAQKSLMKKIESGDQNIKTHCRDMVITPIMLGMTFKIYTGKEFVPLIITLEMLGHSLGEFAHTRKSVSHSAAGVGATRSSKAVSAR
ncbi:30S ribosomal protein S19 [Candidatus Woesearchaeota archaeon]|nr:30S ribosomal protein S19 [Candidatus Woesearchaeota archaeon]